jgi:hypothetical protein
LGPFKGVEILNPEGVALKQPRVKWSEERAERNPGLITDKHLNPNGVALNVDTAKCSIRAAPLGLWNYFESPTQGYVNARMARIDFTLG